MRWARLWFAPPTASCVRCIAGDCTVAIGAAGLAGLGCAGNWHIYLYSGYNSLKYDFVNPGLGYNKQSNQYVCTQRAKHREPCAQVADGGAVQSTDSASARSIINQRCDVMGLAVLCWFTANLPADAHQSHPRSRLVPARSSMQSAPSATWVRCALASATSLTRYVCCTGQLCGSTPSIDLTSGQYNVKSVLKASVGLQVD